MTEFATAPVDQAVDLISTWAEHPWPITQDEAFALRDQLGWTPRADEPRLFTTNLGLVPGTGAIRIRGGRVSNITFQLSSRGAATPDLVAQARSALDAHANALSDRWGKPKRRTHRGVISLEWRLPNGALVALSLAAPLLVVDIESPQQVIADDMAHLDEIETGDA